tara:strand:- start:113 stop:421 length:309 start_codon:yes stop_codon:yes gene_type:complete
MTSVIHGYSISRDDLVESYVRKHYYETTLLIMFDVRNHLDFLTKKGFDISNTYVWDNEIMIFQFSNLENAKYILQNLQHIEAPYSQVWTHGKLIGDNLEHLK